MNCIIIDDEPLARDEMQSLVQEVSQLEIAGKFTDAMTALEFLNLHEVDIIFLDIEMPGVTGLEFAERVPRKSLIIFTTAYSQYAIRSYELDAVDYLLKPMEKTRVEKAIDKAIAYKKLLIGNSGAHVIPSPAEDFLFIKADRKYHKIKFVSIRFIEGLKDYVVIYTQNQKLFTAMNLKNMHQRLPSDIFLRVAKSYVVNKDLIDSFDNHTLYLGESEIPLGDAYRKEFIEKYLGGAVTPDSL